MPRPFEDYFANRSQLVGEQSSNGDEILVLRNATVFRTSSVFNKAFGSIQDNPNFMTISAQSTWYQITGITDVMSTPSFSFANDAYTYIGPTQIYPASITLNCTIIKEWSGNGGEEYEIGIFVNGVLYQNKSSTTVPEDPTQQSKSNVVCIVGIILTQGDVITAHVLNRSGTDNCRIEDLQLVIQQ
jgi:hypothetical protein